MVEFLFLLLSASSFNWISHVPRCSALYHHGDFVSLNVKLITGNLWLNSGLQRMHGYTMLHRLLETDFRIEICTMEICNLCNMESVYKK